MGAQANAAVTEDTYRRLSLQEVIGRIVQDDARALKELFDHRRPCYWQHEPVSIVEFIERWAEQVNARSQDEPSVIEAARDLVLNKLSNLPGSHDDEGPDCRRTYQAYLVYLNQALSEQPQLAALDCERIAMQVLQGQVKRHFQWSLLECRRQGRVRMRAFSWSLGSGQLRVRVPAHLDDETAQQWLDTRLREEVDPARPGEAERIQRRIDSLSQRPHIHSIDEVADPAADPEPFSFAVTHEIDSRGLAATVAREKTKHLDRQRPTIQNLGPDAVQSLICQIFDQLETETFEPAQLARSFGLSKATLSRFAGLRWSNSGEGKIPDLWRNTARLLAHDPRFRDAAESAGVLGRVLKAADEHAEG
jgi:hypothetical protein